MIKISALLVVVFGSLSVCAQQTIGLLTTSTEATEGYTLFTPEKNKSVYLIDNCGEIINKWTFSENPGLTCYLLENGTLLRAGRDSLEIRDWDNALIWSYAMTTNGYSQHHDIEPLPNGNILCILHDTYATTDMIDAGRDSALLEGDFLFDKIIELKPTGTNDAMVVWQWRFMDHLVQDFDASKLNYGVVEDHPELLDLNYGNQQNTDYAHLNGIDYNKSLDQIIISSKHLHELYIIDHSTTLFEAFGHTGGNSNRGGDFLWRWGNPQVYRQGTSMDQKLFDQHDPKWVELPAADSGKISIFNNNGDGSSTFSSIHLILPELTGNTYAMDPNKYLPLNYDWSWNGTILGQVVYSSKKCGAQVLPSGNILFCETPRGMISEITRTGDHVWSYRNPTGPGLTIYNQFDLISAENSLFRGERYPANYSGFIGKNLSPQGIIEDQNSVSQTCIFADVATAEIKSVYAVNPLTNEHLVFNQFVSLEQLEIRDVMGKIVFVKETLVGTECPVSLEKGTYFLRFIYEGNQIQQKLLAY